jgi:hypothetical protein
VQMRELSGPVSDVTGIFTNSWCQPPPHAANQSWVTLSDQNQWTDTCEFQMQSPPPPFQLTNGGSFIYVIPVQWYVTGGSINNFASRTQTHNLTIGGTATITKLGCSATRTP